MLRNLIVALFLPFCIHAQRVEVDLLSGMSNYQGDLQDLFFTVENAKPAFAFNLKYGFNDKLFLRSGFTFGSLAGYDANNIEKNKSRNLDFKTSLQEYTLGFEFHFVDMTQGKLSPYIFAGGGIFHFDPYTYYDDGSGNKKVYLQPLSTEGQGLANYPDRVPYKLTQFCIPYGFGVKYQITCNLNVGVEFRHTKTFTDYIDDVSKNYVDETDLLNARGQLAVDLAWRQDEYNGRPYPVSGTQRGNPQLGDLYYFAGITIGLRFNDCQSGSFSLGGLFNGEKSLFHRTGGSPGESRRIRSQVGCPKF
jgi:opacity protein-like surface antigen